MGDVSWTLTLFMKDAPPGEKFLGKRMQRDLICYFNIFGLVEKYGYTISDNLYCKREGHGRRKACLVKIKDDKDVNKMLGEHEADRKLNLFVEKHSASLNTEVQFAAIHTRTSDEALEGHEDFSDGGFHEGGHDTESCHESDQEAERDEIEVDSEVMKRRNADPRSRLKKHKRQRHTRFESEDPEHEEQKEDFYDPTEPLEDWEEDDEIMQNSSVHSEDEEQDLAELDTNISGVSPERGSIKIIWPNGLVREYRGRFIVANVLSIKSGGKVIVETDENGVPNQRSAGLLASFLRDLAKSSSYVPLHIPRWDSKLLRKPKRRLLTYVETKFVYPEETRRTTEIWMLKHVNKGWRYYKHFLKSTYYTPHINNGWSLDRIKKRVPPGVNKHQWISLLETWCQEQHRKTCLRNSEAGKQQRHPHTTGRKSHARLKKEMEVKNNGPVSKIDLWDEAHKKKDGKYTTESVQQLMQKARKDLEDVKKKNGNLSPEDYDRVFEDVIAKESKIGGYYDEKYCSNTRLSGGSTSVEKSAREVRVEKELQDVKADLKNVTGFMERMCAFMAQNYPDEDWLNEVMAARSEMKMGGQPEEDQDLMLHSNNISVNISDRVGDGYDLDDVEKSTDNAQTTENDPKEAQFPYIPTSKDRRNKTGEASTRKELPKQRTSQQVNVPKKVSSAVFIRHKVNETMKSNENVQISEKHKVNDTVESNENVQTSKKNANPAHAAKGKENSRNSSSAGERRFVKKKHKEKIVVLLSLTPRNKGLVVGKGIIESKDNEYVVGGDALGDAFWGITVLDISALGSEKLPRPYGDIQTVEDAIDHCIAWPITHVKRVKDGSY